MLHRLTPPTLLIATLALTLVIGVLIQTGAAMSSPPRLLTDPFLQLPTEASVRVVWFTEFAGSRHTVAWDTDLKRTATARTARLSRTREDEESPVVPLYRQLSDRPIWRHEAEVTGLIAGKRLPYQVTSVREDGKSVTSEIFSLAAKPVPGTPLKVLLTSDHQLKHMVAANLQKVVETIGRVDLVLFAGDLVNVPDRASEWFDDQKGGAFFPALQGRATYELERNGVRTRYRGGALLQHAPMYTAIGNHEVMGRFSLAKPLDTQFTDSVPDAAAAALYKEKAAFINPKNDPAIRAAWLKNNSFNVDTYEEIFSLPESQSGGKKYYAVTFGDLRLVVLYITNVWRHPGLEPATRGKYREREQDFDQPENWGYGQHLFEPIAKGSPQYTWLQQELASPEFKQAKYRVVMFHHPPHSLGENSVPAYTDPVQKIERNPDGKITAIRYEYPRSDDYIIRDVVPLLEQANVQLVFFGHSHLWNRFVSPSGMHFLETSNVGNSYGAHLGDRQRRVPTGYKEDYVAIGNPNGLQPILPTISPLRDETSKPMPYIASNDITVFSIFDTGTGTVSSYRFDTREPKSAVIKFDEFQLRK
jgi:Icc-related predicted phosphoesterase